MRYQEQQKGLFTFYKQQESYQMQIEQLKRKKQEEESQRKELAKQNSSRSHYNVSKSFSPERYFKISSQPSVQDEDSECTKLKITKCMQIGNSIIIINGKNTEKKDPKKSPSEQIFQSRSKQDGYFIENKNIQFFDLEKDKSLSSVLVQKRKRSYRRKVEYKVEEKERKNTKLPTIMKAEEVNSEDRQPISYRIKANGSSRRYNGGDLMKYIRSNIQSENRSYQPEKSVSYIQYSQGYIKQYSPKKLLGLNEEQKRLLDVLYRYKKTDK